MVRAMIMAACTTGLFCAGFAFVISQIAPMLTNTQVLTTSFVSGFLGSVVAQILIKR
ncbi:hypothetical protein SAMN04488044_0395 [Cognatishimia maritima]|uniref:Uncharacterized protein n=1 Tax=Cognatishimia maritima TaxID=870908 RepID=A0A1M5IPH1_9RHOB|nr:hypothetical protein SAMN04488044_0395 [Cognatishimia maritima]